MPATHIYFPIGFLFPSDRAPIEDPAGYNDLRGMRWNLGELKLDLELGNLPAGMIIQMKGGLAGVVVPDPDEGGQRIQPLEEALLSLQKG